MFLVNSFDDFKRLKIPCKGFSFLNFAGYNNSRILGAKKKGMQKLITAGRMIYMIIELQMTR